MNVFKRDVKEPCGSLYRWAMCVESCGEAEHCSSWIISTNRGYWVLCGEPGSADLVQSAASNS